MIELMTLEFVSMPNTVRLEESLEKLIASGCVSVLSETFTDFNFDKNLISIYKSNQINR